MVLPEQNLKLKYLKNNTIYSNHLKTSHQSSKLKLYFLAIINYFYTYMSKQMITLLYIEDDLSYATLVKEWLKLEGITTFIANTKVNAKKLFLKQHPDLLLVDLDLSLPKEGLEIIQEILIKYPHFPIIVYSVHADPETVIATMNLGVMHHVNKDRSIPELVAMIRNAYKQAYRNKDYWNPEYHLSAITTFNFQNNTLIINGKQQPLKKTAGKLLKQLCMHINEFVSPAELSHALWGFEKEIRELKRYIQNLRELLKEDPDIQIINQNGGYYQLECNAWK